MSAETDLAWLAGLIDGEGCLYARYVASDHRCKHRHAFEVRLEIQTVSSRMLDAVERICTELGVAYIRSAPTWMPKSTRPAHRIRINRKRSLHRLLGKLAPYLVVKQAEAARLLQYLDSACSTYFYDLQPEDCSLADDLKALKRNA